jgi:membrane-associated PAP2 superfamily phosphatase
MLGGGDRLASAPFYDPLQQRFPLKDAWLLSVLGHTGLKWPMLAFWAACLALGQRWRRGALDMALIAIAVTLAKYSSPFSCPWDLVEYGGSGAPAGGCLPAAHPITGFALFGLYFALRDESPRVACAVLAAAWLIGLLAGAVQIARGAHFVSHVLWTAWLAWLIAWSADYLRRNGRAIFARWRESLSKYLA